MLCLLERGEYLTKEELDEAYCLLLKTRAREEMTDEEERRINYLFPMIQSAADLVRREILGAKFSVC